MDLQHGPKRKQQHSVLQRRCSLNKVLLCFQGPGASAWPVHTFYWVMPKVKFASVQINLKPKLKIQLQNRMMTVEI